MKMSELDTLIRKIVQEEFKTTAKSYIRAYIPVVMKEVVDELVEKRLLEVLKETRTASPKGKSSLKEQIATELEEEWSPEEVTMPRSKSKLSNLMGAGGKRFRGPLNTIENIVTENGAIVPVPQDAIPGSVIEALNKDYRSFMKRVDEHKGAGAGIPLGTVIERGGF